MTDEAAKAAGVLEALGGLELLVAELYAGFAEAFPEDAALWRDLVRDERDHAAAAAALRDMVGRCGGRVDPSKANLAVLATYRKGLEDQAARLRKGGIARKAALFIARDLERTLIERRFYDVVACDDAAFGSVRDGIQDATGTHFGKLESYIEKLGL